MLEILKSWTTLLIFYTLNLRLSQYLSQFLKYKKQTTFWKFQNKVHLMLPNSWEAKLCRQDFSFSILFLLTPGPPIYQSSLIWTLNFTSNFFKTTNNFYTMNDNQNENLLDWNHRYTMQGFKMFSKNLGFT